MKDRLSLAIAIPLVVLLLLSRFLPFAAGTASDGGYSYPYEDPIIATSTFALLESRYADRVGTYVELSILPSREEVPQLEQHNKLGILFYTQQGPADLVLIIPGLGGYSLDSAPQWLAEQFFDRGFHVIVLPSAFNWRFSIAASTTGRPGITRMDALDLIRVIRTALDHWRKEIRQPIRSIGLLGYSLGALQAAFVTHNWHAESMGASLRRVLLINPPVDLRRSVVQLDALYRVPGWSPAKAREVKGDILGAAIVYVRDHDINDPGYFEDLEEKFDFNREEFEFGIGARFREALSKVIFASQQVHDLKILQAPVDPPRFAERLAEAKQFSFGDYYRRFLLPHAAEKTGEELFRYNGLQSIEDFLRDNEAIFLVHNEDDILLGPGDVDYLRRLFKDRAVIYPKGGHLGNLWFPKNLEEILNVFRPGPRYDAASDAPSRR